jgi:hypothetical protein
MELARTSLLVATLAALGCAPEKAPEQMPPPATRVLAGGGRLLVLERPELEVLEGTVRFESGSIREPAHLAGLTRVLSEVLYYGGPLQLTGAEYHERLLARESTLLISPRAETVDIDFTCPPGELEETLDAIAQLIVTPGYPPEFIERARDRLVDELELESEDPGAVADRLLMDLCYGADAAHTRRPTIETVEAVTREALLAFHAESLVRERMWVAVVGPVNAGDVALRVASDFEELERGAPAAPVPERSFRAPDESRVVELVLPHSSRVELRFAAPGIDIASPDFAALRLWSDAVAGGSAWTGAFFAPRWSGGELFGFTSGSADVLALLAHLDPQRFPAERLETARARVLAAEDESASAWNDLDRALDLARHELPADFWTRHRGELETLDADAVQAAAGRHLPQGGVLVAAVHPAEPEPAPLPSERHDSARALRGTPEAVAALERLFERLGGRERWANLVGLHLRGEVTLTASDEPVAVEIWRDFLGRRLRLEQTRAGATTVQVVAPDGAWTASGGTTTKLTDQVFRHSVHRERRLVFRVLHDLALAKTLSARMAEGRLEVLRAGRVHGWFELAEDGRPTRWVVARSEYEELFATDLEAWMDTDGYALPGLMIQPELGRAFTWLEAWPNPAFDDGVFRVE